MNPSNPKDDLSPATVREASPAALEELQYQFEGLRGLFLFALLALIALTLTADLCFVRKQMVLARAQLDDLRPKVSEKVANYKKRTEPLVKNFTASMQNFAASNHDFQPILAKYRPVLWPYMAASPSATPPSPAAKPPQAPPN